jgi:aspartyl-tRNA(Asn)/glutamyl-tRNA(Gln) amidotransferase subunit A
VAAGLVPFALGSDTGGSVRQPAAFCGVVGLKPTYGAVSRFGLVAYASSLECIGVLADSVGRARKVFDTIRGKDPFDQTSREAPNPSPFGCAPACPPPVAGGAGGGVPLKGTIGVLKTGDDLDAPTRRGLETAKSTLAGLGYTLREIDLASLKYVVPAYYTIATAEASANLARYDGIRYGQRPEWAENPDDLVDKTRDAGFGPEVKLRILLGTFVLRSGFQDRYYLRAQRIRAAIKAEFETILTGVDAILSPVFPTRAFPHGEAGLTPFQQKAADLYTCSANLAGLPALSFPASLETDNGATLPVGVQLIGPAFGEETLFHIAEDYEKAKPFPHPEGYRKFWS